jgi:hypothetical protein
MTIARASEERSSGHVAVSAYDRPERAIFLCRGLSRSPARIGGKRDGQVRGTDRKESILCPIDLFPQQEAEISRLTEAINQARTAAEKAPFAQALVEVAGVLLACNYHDQESMDCRLCRNLAGVRQRTAGLIVQVGRLSH